MEGTLPTTMREWIERQLAAGLPAFGGSSVTGTLALKQELLNELVTEWLTATTTGGTTPPVDIERLKPLVKRLAVRAEPGTVLVDFTVAV